MIFYLLKLKALLGILLLGIGQVMLGTHVSSTPALLCWAENARIDSVFFRGSLQNAWNESLQDLLESGCTIGYRVRAELPADSTHPRISMIQSIRKDLLSGKYVLQSGRNPKCEFADAEMSIEAFQQFHFALPSGHFLRRGQCLTVSVEMQLAKGGYLTLNAGQFWNHRMPSHNNLTVHVEIQRPLKHRGRENVL